MAFRIILKHALHLLRYCIYLTAKLNSDGKGDIKNFFVEANVAINLAQSLQTQVYFPCYERPPILSDHGIQWFLYTGFAVVQNVLFSVT